MGAGPDYIHCASASIVLYPVHYTMNTMSSSNDRRRELARLRKQRQRQQQSLEIRRRQTRIHQQEARDREISQRRSDRACTRADTTHLRSAFHCPAFLPTAPYQSLSLSILYFTGLQGFRLCGRGTTLAGAEKPPRKG